MTKHHYIEVKNLVKTYGAGDRKVKAVDHVNFYVDKGGFIGIMGASGSGKTTILNVLSTIDTMTEGEIFYDGISIANLKEDELSDFRQKNLGFVFQDYNLLDTLSIEENIMLPMVLSRTNTGGRQNGRAHLKAEIEARVNRISEILGICDILGKFPYEVSGGQKQRAACARAIVNHPKLLLADEPTGALDSKSSAALLHTFQLMNQELDATILMVTHDVFSACCCDRILFLNDGKIRSELERGNLNKRDYLNRILDVQAGMGGEESYAE